MNLTGVLSYMCKNCFQDKSTNLFLNFYHAIEDLSEIVELNLIVYEA